MPVESGRLEANYEAMPTWLLVILAALFWPARVIYDVGKMGCEASGELVRRLGGDKEA